MERDQSRALIRSWSGNHVYGDIINSSSFFYDDDLDDEIEISHAEQFDDSDRWSAGVSVKSNSEISQSSDLYDDDDDFCSIDSKESIHLVIKSSDSESAQFHPSIEDVSVGGYYPDDPRENIRRLDQGKEDTENKHDANSRHKAWLAQLQSALKNERREDEERQLRNMRRERRSRRHIVENARQKGKGGYDSITVSALHSQAKLVIQEEEENGVDSAVSDHEERMKQARERRRRHKQYLDELVQKREMEVMDAAYAEMQAEERREKLTKLVLYKMKTMSKRRTAYAPDGPDENKSTKTEMSEKDGVQEPPHIHDKEMSRTLRAKCMNHLAEVQRARKEKKEKTEKLKRRLDKRAAILRRQYDEKLPSEKPWERCESNSKETKLPSVEPKVRGKDYRALPSVMEEQVVKSSRSEESPPCILSPSMIEAMTERLSRNSKPGMVRKSSDFETWRQQSGVEAHQKVFCISGWYPSIRNDLFQRGWFLNDDKESNFFDMKFTLSSTEIDFAYLSSTQIVNHFKSSGCLTTKAGLIHTLKNTPFFALRYHEKDMFFPRSYDLSYLPDLHCFLDDHHCLQAQAVLGRLLKLRDVEPLVKVNVGVVTVLCKVTQNYFFKPNEESFINGRGYRGAQCFNAIESLVIQFAEDWIYRCVYEIDLESNKTFIKLLETMRRNKKPSEEMNSRIEKWWTKMKKKALASLSDLVTLDEELARLIVSSLEESKCQRNQPQFTINGVLTNNLWILKPAGKSRGRGIEVFQSLKEILNHIRPTMDGGKPSQFVIQKYLENPLTIAGRKFDLRQWVMVSDWNPLTIWFYKDCYVRFAVEEYDNPQQADGSSSKLNDQWTKNKYRHLVNNSIGKNSKDFKNSFLVEDTGCAVDGCMWPLRSFKEWLVTTTGEDKWEKTLAPEIKNIVVDTILCAQETMIPGRKRCFEVYGFDIMIDDNFHPWLIEINSSPACDYSTQVTESFVKRALPDVLKVVLDHHNEWTSPAATRYNNSDGNSSNRNDLNTGDWENIHIGKVIPKVAARFGSDMSLRGVAIRKPKRVVPPRGGKTKCAPKYQSFSTATNTGGRNGTNDNDGMGKDNIVPPDDLIFDDSDLSDYEHRQGTLKEKQRQTQESSSVDQHRVTDTSKEENAFSHENKENCDIHARAENKATTRIAPSAGISRRMGREKAQPKLSVPLKTITLEMKL